MALVGRGDERGVTVGAVGVVEARALFHKQLIGWGSVGQGRAEQGMVRVRV